ncbi:MAG: hypothetical protein M3169_12265 [Candidatus Eremiobacteraeota bacterium]|nr:hypothetical protein [Candidatus Eremiobacteraeota bacterium]
MSAADRRTATAIARCFSASRRVSLRYAAAPYEGGTSPIFIVFIPGHTAVKALNNDLYYDRSRGIVFPVPGEPSVAPDPADRPLSNCLARARVAAR